MAWTNKCNVDGVMWTSATEPTACPTANGAHTDITTTEE